MARTSSPLGITVASNAREVARRLAAIGRDQLPFAAAVTLTRTAQRHVERQRRKLPRVFKVRSKGLPKRIRLAAAASKRDWPHPQAVVGYGKQGQDEFWRLQETGGTKRARNGGRLAIPLRVAERKRGVTGAIKSAYRPPRIVKSKTGFEDVEDHTIRARLGGRGEAKGRVFRWYFMKRSARVKKSKLRAREDARDLQLTFMPRTFEREMIAALRSARMRNSSFSTEIGRALYLQARAKGR